MTAVDLRNKIIRNLRHMDAPMLLEVMHWIQQRLDHESGSDHWNTLSKEQQGGILEALHDLDAGKGISHETVMSDLHKKYAP